MRCSVSYNDQVLETYTGHHGPLYRIRFSPHNTGLFLTCSADWSMQLYCMASTTPLVTLQAQGQDAAVNDVAWAPGNSTVFAAVTENSKIQLWVCIYRVYIVYI